MALAVCTDKRITPPLTPPGSGSAFTETENEICQSAMPKYKNNGNKTPKPKGKASVPQDCDATGALDAATMTAQLATQQLEPKPMTSAPDYSAWGSTGQLEAAQSVPPTWPWLLQS